MKTLSTAPTSAARVIGFKPMGMTGRAIVEVPDGARGAHTIWVDLATGNARHAPGDPCHQAGQPCPHVQHAITRLEYLLCSVDEADVAPVSPILEHLTLILRDVPGGREALEAYAVAAGTAWAECVREAYHAGARSRRHQTTD